MSRPGDLVAGGEARRARNLRTALVLLSVAAAFFVGIVVRRLLIGG